MGGRLFICLALCLIVGALAQDYCDFPVLPQKNYWAGDYYTVFKCFNSLSFDYPKALETVAVLNQLVDLYSFTDIVTDSGEPWNLKVDLRAGLRNILRKVNDRVYASDYEFHTDLVNLFNPIYDAHTLYRYPQGYGAANFVRPFAIESVYVNNSQQFYLRQGPMGDEGDELFLNLTGLNPKKYHNMRVMLIGDKDPIDYFLDVANRAVGNYKDIQVRFNQLMRVKGWAFVPLLRFSLLSLDPYTAFVLENGDTLVTSNLIIYPGGLNTSLLIQKNAFNCTFCKPSVAAEYTTSITPFYQKHIIDPHKEVETIFQSIVGEQNAHYNQPSMMNIVGKDQTIKAMQKTQLQYVGPSGRGKQQMKKYTKILPVIKGEPSMLRIIAKDDANETIYMQYTLPNLGVLPILKLKTFAPSKENQSINVLTQLLQDAEINRFESVLLDMSKNGGGIICLSDLLLASMAPEWAGLNLTAPEVAYGIYDFRRSKTSDTIMGNAITRNQVINSTIYVDVHTRKQYEMNDLSWYYTQHTYTRGGRTSNYTTKAYFPNECEDYAAIAARQKYFFKNVLILTDGTCGSACSLFVSQMMTYKKGVVISHGGVISSNVPIDTSSFAGGNVLDWPTFAALFNISGISSDPQYPQSFPTSAGGRFNFNEYYTTLDSTIPREFLKLPADYHLYQWDAIFNDDVATTNGLIALANLYAGAAQVLQL